MRLAPSSIDLGDKRVTAIVVAAGHEYGSAFAREQPGRRPPHASVTARD
jgi:hypothetical protein